MVVPADVQMVASTLRGSPNLRLLAVSSAEGVRIAFLPGLSRAFPEQAFFDAIPRPAVAIYGEKRKQSGLLVVRRDPTDGPAEGYAWLTNVEQPFVVQASELPALLPMPEVWK